MRDEAGLHFGAISMIIFFTLATSGRDDRSGMKINATTVLKLASGLSVENLRTALYASAKIAEDVSHSLPPPKASRSVW